MNIPTRTVVGLNKKPIAPKPAPTKKVFKVGTPEVSNRGYKILLHADTGMGKSTLAALAPKPVFIDIDRGCGDLLDSLGQRVQPIPGVETFQDVRAALQQTDLYDSFDSIVIDNVTILQDLAELDVVDTIPTDKGQKVKNLLGYGWNAGYKHLYNHMKLVLADCDALVAAGKNVILIAQSNPNKIANPAGEDYLCQGPRLYAGKPSIEALYCEWSDQLFYITYQDIFTKDKKASGGSTRVIYTQPEVYFRAKSRRLHDGSQLPAAVAFSDITDRSLWALMGI